MSSGPPLGLLMIIGAAIVAVPLLLIGLVLLLVARGRRGLRIAGVVLMVLGAGVLVITVGLSLLLASIGVIPSPWG